jgi:hypothetical protein
MRSFEQELQIVRRSRRLDLRNSINGFRRRRFLCDQDVANLPSLSSSTRSLAARPGFPPLFSPVPPGVHVNHGRAASHRKLLILVRPRQQSESVFDRNGFFDRRGADAPMVLLRAGCFPETASDPCHNTALGPAASGSSRGSIRRRFPRIPSGCWLVSLCHARRRQRNALPARPTLMSFRLQRNRLSLSSARSGPSTAFLADRSPS